MEILKYRKIYLSVSLIFFLISIFLFFGTKLNLGIDMTGGTQSEYMYSQSVNLDNLRNVLKQKSQSIVHNNNKVINNISIYKISGEKKIGITVGYDNSIEEKQLNILKNNFRNEIIEVLKNIDKNIIEISYTNIGKSFGDYIKNTAFLTLLIAIIAITLYITYAFSGVITGISILSFSLITIITLFHDIIITSGFYIGFSHFFPEFKIDTYFITALLTILGYSINDTIVIFDRIRSNLKIFGGKSGKQGKTLGQIIQLSINESLKRSIYTSLTLIFVLLTIFFFGPETISGFILVMILGTCIGTYSSIFIASPILYIVNRNNKLSVYKKIEINPEDKIVV